VSLYSPTSACGVGCLPKPGVVPQVGRVRRGLRLTGVVLALLTGVLIAAAYPVLGQRGREVVVRRFFRVLLRAAGVKLRVIGDPQLAPRPGTLITSNHVSWLDIPAIMAVETVRVVAKTDVRQWPLIGLMAAKAGCIFIDRRHIKRLPETVAEIATSLHNGQSVLIFPEGSTWCGRTQGRYYPAAFQSAIDANAPVRPVALRYRLADGRTTTQAAFVGDDSLLASVLRVVAIRGLTVEIEAGPVADARGAARKSMASTTASVIRELTTATPHISAIGARRPWLLNGPVPEGCLTSG
jgi:1-acyl-sn-glycerol-3-phosphate acyltransferase